MNFPVLDHDWVYFDDDINVLLNPHLTGGSWETVKWAWTDFTYARRYLPIGWMVFDGLFAIDGLNPATFNAASWLLSALNASLLFVVVRRWAATAAPRSSPAWRDGFSFALCLVFSIHSLLAQIAGWKSGLLYLTATFLALAACCLDPWIDEPPPNAKRRIAAVVLFGCSLTTYPIHLTLPLLLALAPGRQNDAAPPPGVRDFFRRISRHRTWLSLSLAIGALNYFAAAAASHGNSALPDLTQRGVGERLVQASATLLSYVGRIVLPGKTSIYYGSQSGPLPAWWFTTVVIVATALMLSHRRTRRRTLQLLAVIGISLLPFLGLVDPDQTASDRYALPLLMALTAVGTVACTVILATFARLVAMGAVLVTVLSFVHQYRAALNVWKDTEHLQGRVDDVTSARPNLKLSFTRPAIVAFLLGDAAESRRRLDVARQRYGESPAIMEAESFIAETTTWLASQASRETRSVPYAAMHLEIARQLKARDHVRAADYHAVFAYRLLSARR